MLNGEDDYFARWMQGVCAVVLGVAGIGGTYMIWHSTGVMWILGGITLKCACFRLSYRCARYAITGQGNVNRVDFR